jgi:hypothetical protein
MPRRKISLWAAIVVGLALIGATFFWSRYLRIPTNVAYVSEEGGKPKPTKERSWADRLVENYRKIASHARSMTVTPANPRPRYATK